MEHSSLRRGSAQTAPARRYGLADWSAAPPGEYVVLVVMVLALALFYRASPQLPMTALGLALFAALALLRPDMALRFVPLTAPLFFMPKGVWDARFGIRDAGVSVPLHEVVLLVTLAATGARLLWRLRGRADQAGAVEGGGLARAFARRAAHALRANPFCVLFLIAGTLGVLLAQPGGRGAALREWRWLVVEPLLFYSLIPILRPGSAEAWGLGARAPLEPARRWSFVVYPFLIGGALVGLLGILQFLGLDLVPAIGTKAGFSEDRIFVEGVQRVSSVYGHPNNLGLYMGRVWPLAAALALGELLRSGERWAGDGTSPSRLLRGPVLLLGCCALLALGGMLVSFSKGAVLGGLVALVVLALGGREHLPAGIRRLLLPLIGAALALAVVAALVLGVERINPLGATSAIRLSTWASALAMLRDHPVFGVGLDQFVLLYPRYIDPALAATNERFTSHPHNLLLDIWLRMGLLGLVTFGGLLARFWRRLAPALRRGFAAPLAVGLAAAMAAALTHGLVDNFYFVPDLAFAFWLFLALAEPDGAMAAGQDTAPAAPALN